MAPSVEHLVLVFEGCGSAKTMPHIRVACRQLERDLLTAAAYQDRQRVAQRRRVQLAQPLFDDRQRLAEIPQTAGAGAELIALLLIVALQPARAEAQDPP